MDIHTMYQQAQAYQETLQTAKAAAAAVDFPWYPYQSLNNFYVLDQLLTGTNRQIFGQPPQQPIADIGAADGEVSFFLESLGYDVHIIDNAPTNNNHLAGVRLLKQHFQSSVVIHEADLDNNFSLPAQQYHLTLLLGILYHLKNPFSVLEHLAQTSRYCLLSTRIAQFTPDRQINFATMPAAYLVDTYETNNDATNFWIFSEAGLRRLLSRTGWHILDYQSFGDTTDSDPASMAHDERAFCLLESRYFTT